MPRTERLVTSRGDFAVLADGPAEGPLVLLLHGFPELNLSWQHQIPVLARAGYRVVAPNQRGYPGSERNGPYRPGDLAADVVAMLDALGAPRAILVGHDWGGAVAWTVAQRHPERVAGLAAMNCPPPQVLGRALLRSPAQVRRSWYVLFFQLPRVPERVVAARMPALLVAGSHNGSAWSRQRLAAYSDAFAGPADVSGPIGWYRAAARAALRGRAPRQPIDVPVLVIWGVHDRFLGRDLVTPESLRGTLAEGRAAQVVEIPGAGHFVQNEAPSEVNEALLTWLGDHAGGAC